MIEGIVDTLQKFLDSRLLNVHTMLPGTITKYSGHTDRKATVLPMVKTKLLNGSDLPIQPIDNVPVVFPSSNTFSLLFPVKAGDGCIIIFSEAGIGNYLSGAGEVKEADDLSRFSLTDAVCVPGLWPFSLAPTNTNLSTIEINDAGIIAINGDTKPFVTHAELNTALQTFITALNLHVHPTAAVGPPSPPATPMSINIAPAATTTVKTGG